MSAESDSRTAIWDGGALPAGVQVGDNTRITGSSAFRRFCGQAADALVIGNNATLDGVQFSVGPESRIAIGNYCCFTNAVLMSELSITIGNYVLIGWNAVIADSDFHPIAPAQRIADAVAYSPVAAGRLRPPVESVAVVIEDNVWIGFDCCILPGVHIGEGSIIGARSVVDQDVPAYCVAAGIRRG